MCYRTIGVINCEVNDMKKRWIWLCVAAVIGAAVLLTATQTPEAVSVETMTLKPQRVEQTVSCMGAVEAVDGHGVFAPVSCLVTEVKVREGPRVKKGDVLALIDREATRQLLGDPSELVALAALEEELTAQKDGIVISVPAQAGQILELGTPCALIAYDEDIRVRIAIREKDLRVLRPGMTVRISGDGLINTSYEGTLTEIASAARADLSGGTVVEGVVTMRDGAVDPSFRLGLTTKAVVVTDVMAAGLVIPYDAVVSDESGSYVFLAEKGNARRYDLKKYRYVPSGVLLLDSSLKDASVILTPGQVTVGCMIKAEEAAS